MMRSNAVAVAMGAAAASPLVFTVLPQATQQPQPSLRGAGAARPENKTSSFTGLMLALGMGGAAIGARASVARAVIGKDSKGRFRFTTGGAATLVAPSGSAPITWSDRDSPFTKAWEKEIGATFPLCAEEAAMWDPLGFSKNPAKFPQYRAAEIKHGRVAMMAVAGLMVQDGYRLPYIIDGERILPLTNAENGLAALQDKPASIGFALIVLMAGFFEMAIFTDKGRSPGDFGDPLNWGKQTEHAVDGKRMKTAEIEHGRLAMLGVLGSFMAEYVTGYSAVDQWKHAGEGASRLIKLTFMNFA